MADPRFFSIFTLVLLFTLKLSTLHDLFFIHCFYLSPGASSHSTFMPALFGTLSPQTDTPLQPQAPSSTSQQQHHQQGSHSSNNSSGNSNQGYQYAPSHPERTVSGGFDTVKAGPPSPGSKMDLLPFPHHHNQQQSQNSQSSQQLPSSSHTKDGAASSSSRHRSSEFCHIQLLLTCMHVFACMPWHMSTLLELRTDIPLIALCSYRPLIPPSKPLSQYIILPSLSSPSTASQFDRLPDRRTNTRSIRTTLS